MGQKNPPPDERVVYLALKNLFKGQNAQVRKSKTVAKLIKGSNKEDAVANLLREHDFDTICTMAGRLLSAKIFESTLKAKVHFPELFDSSPAQSAEKEASEAEAARNEANAIKDATQNRYKEIQSDDPQHVDAAHADDAEGKQAEFTETPTVSKHTAAVKQHMVHMPSLFPLYLPLSVQHKLFVYLQGLLERVCYTYGTQAMPEVLQGRGWDCPEAVELNRWTDEFSKRTDIFRKKPDVGKPINQLFQSLANIRHTAVHRIRLSAKGIEKYLSDAELFVTLIGDTVHLETIDKLRRETLATMEELERNKHLLQVRFGEELRNIADQRAQLDSAERSVIAEILKEDSEYQILAGKHVEEAIAPSEVSFSTAINAVEEKGAIDDDTDSTNEYYHDDGHHEDEWGDIES
ncbi:ubiquinol-cytochrome-c reductase cytochrome c1 [Metarhizium brunneum]